MAKAFINPQALDWATKRAGFTPVDVARHLKKSDDEVLQWYKGTEKPTLAQAQKVAKFTKTPFGYLFTSSIPDEHSVDLPDFRQTPNPKPLGLDFQNLYFAVEEKQAWYREYLKNCGVQPRTFVGVHHIKDPMDQLIHTIDRIIGDFPRKPRHFEDYLRKLVAALEHAGIMVLQASTIGRSNIKSAPDVFRGFALVDDLAPLIFINAADAKAAQIFTLIHELVHILIGRAGISDLGSDTGQATTEASIERFCNQVAGEWLVPTTFLQEQWRQDEDLFEQYE